VPRKHGGGLMGLSPKIIQRQYLMSTAFPTDQSHHPGNGSGLPSRAIARPSSVEEGNKNIRSPHSAFAGMTTKKLPPASGDNPHEKS